MPIGADYDGPSYDGSAYVFERSGTVWAQQEKFIADDGVEDDYFGASIALSGDTVFVGAYPHDGGAGSYSGAVYVFLSEPVVVPAMTAWGFGGMVLMIAGALAFLLVRGKLVSQS